VSTSSFAQPDSLSDGVVTLRPWREDFAAALVERINDAAVAEFMDIIPQPYGLSDAHEFLGRSRDGWLTGQSTNFAIFVDGVEGATGGIGIHWNDRENGVAEVGYWVGAAVRRRGVASAATKLAARWAFEAAPDLERLQLRADEQNVASNRVAEKAGFTREGVLRSSRYNIRLERRVDFVMWSLLRSEL
jgi:RimJ/RimL family protein N-acetyltransferase